MRAVVMMNRETLRFSNTLTSGNKEYKTSVGAAAAMVEAVAA